MSDVGVVSNGQNASPAASASGAGPVGKPILDASTLAAIQTEAGVVLDLASHAADIDGADGSAKNGQVEYAEYLAWKKAQGAEVSSLSEAGLASAADAGYFADRRSVKALQEGILSPAFDYGFAQLLAARGEPLGAGGAALLDRPTLEGLAAMDTLNPEDPAVMKLNGALLPMTLDELKSQAGALLARLDAVAPGYFNEGSPRATLADIGAAMAAPVPQGVVGGAVYPDYSATQDPAARETLIIDGISQALGSLSSFSDTASIAEHNADPAADRDNEMFGERGLSVFAGLRPDSGVFGETGRYDGYQFWHRWTVDPFQQRGTRADAIAAAQFLMRPEVMQVLKAHAAQWGLMEGGNLLFSPDLIRAATPAIFDDMV